MATLRDHEADLSDALQRLEPRTSYAEVMAEAAHGARLRFDRAATAPEASPRIQGAVFRAWDGSAWVEAVARDLGRAALLEAVETLGPKLQARSARPAPGESATGRGEKTTVERRPLDDVSFEDLRELAKRFFGFATSVRGVENALVNLSKTTDERLFLSSTGARRYQRVARAHAAVVPLAIQGGKVEYDYVSMGETGGAEVWEKLTEASITHAAREAVALLSAGSAPTGKMTVLLDPSTSGTFAHESFGHGTESDQLLRDRSYLKPLLGQTVGPECLTLVDDGSYPTGWGTIYFDDEGHPSRRTVLVDRGRFVQVLHDRESAAAMHSVATGNTRRADFLSRPFVRMTNTFVEPGDRPFDELVREAKEGVILETCTSGIEDPLGGNMQIKVKKGHRIVRGEVGGILPSMALSGKVLEFLKAIRGVSPKSDFAMSPGFCGKGHTDLLPAGTGGVYLLSEAVVGPA